MYVIWRHMKTSQCFDLLPDYIAFFSFFVAFRFLYEFQTWLSHRLYFNTFNHTETMVLGATNTSWYQQAP